jgi:hypothetical protein
MRSVAPNELAEQARSGRVIINIPDLLIASGVVAMYNMSMPQAVILPAQEDEGTGLRGRGRPRYEAKLDSNSDDFVESAYLCFCQAIKGLSWREVMALSRALHLHYATVYRWRSGRRFPVDFKIVFTVIKWVEQGKPMVLRSPPWHPYQPWRRDRKPRDSQLRVVVSKRLRGT